MIELEPDRPLSGVERIALFGTSAEVSALLWDVWSRVVEAGFDFADADLAVKCIQQQLDGIRAARSLQ